MGQPLAGISDAEAPGDADSGAIARRHAGRDLLRQYLLGREPTIQSLARQTAHSSSAMLSQEPCVGVKCHSSRSRMRRASCGGKAW
jgi:hypothetical protein